MTLRHLRLFVEVYRTENITKAADRLHMTQPTVTRGIQELEAYYNIKLFDRINRRLSITDAGRQFYYYAARTLDSYDLMEQNVHDWEENRTIKIGTSQGIGSILLPKIIPQFRKLHPNITIRSLVSDSKNIQDSLENNHLDFAIIEGVVQNDNLEVKAFSKDALVLLLPPNDPLSKKESLKIDDIRDAAFLLREKGSVARIFIDNIFSSHGLILDPIMESASTHALVQSVHAGIGISILPENLVRYSIDSGFVSTNTLEDIPLIKQNYLVWHKGKYISETVKELMEIIKQGEWIQTTTK